MPDVPEPLRDLILTIHGHFVELAVGMKSEGAYPIGTVVYKINAKEEHSIKNGIRGTILGSIRYTGVELQGRVMADLYGIKEILYVIRWGNAITLHFIGDGLITDVQPIDYVEPDPYEF